MAKAVIIDDEAPILELMTKFCRSLGHDITACQTGTAGIAALREIKPDLVVVDLLIGDVNGLDIIKLCRSELPSAAVIMVTGHGSVETAVEAMRLGAFDYLTKPFELPDLQRTIEQALGQKATAPPTSAPQPAPVISTTKIIGQSNAIQKIAGLIQRVADNDSPILLEGEFGVGKQLIARSIHESSRRSSASFKAIQCSALPEDLLESELFGHGNPQSSIFARTRGGTVHLAEIHHLPMRIQAQLNALLEQIVSSNTSYNSAFNFRLITSTTQSLEESIRANKFREDLYYKICVVPVSIPPLRERREDIALLVEHFLREQALRSGGQMKKMERYAEEFLEKYSWPGNISELRNAVERSCALSETNAIKPTDLPSKVTQKVEAPMSPGDDHSGTQKLPIGSTLDDFIRGQEKLFINETLKLNNGSREKTASMLGVSIATLYRKMDLNVERKTTS
jgi:DNA-binding NtrC family response regulator